jgi:hypothetical protein
LKGIKRENQERNKNKKINGKLKMMMLNLTVNLGNELKLNRKI